MPNGKKWIPPWKRIGEIPPFEDLLRGANELLRRVRQPLSGIPSARVTPTAEEFAPAPDIGELIKKITPPMAKFFDKALRFAPWSQIGMMQKQASEEPAFGATAKVTAPMEMEPSLAKTPEQAWEEYKSLPFLKQLEYEAPFWAATMLIPGATAVRASLAAKSVTGVPKVGVEIARTLLAPLAGTEWVVGKTLEALFGKPIAALAKKVSDVRMRSAFHNTAVYKRLQNSFKTQGGKRFEDEIFRSYKLYQQGNDDAAQGVLNQIYQAFPGAKPPEVARRTALVPVKEPIKPPPPPARPTPKLPQAGRAELVPEKPVTPDVMAKSFIDTAGTFNKEQSEFLTRYFPIVMRIHLAEKTTSIPPELMKIRGWRAFSKARGYTEEEIADYALGQKMVREGKRLDLSIDDLNAVDFEVAQFLKSIPEAEAAQPLEAPAQAVIEGVTPTTEVAKLSIRARQLSEAEQFIRDELFNEGMIDVAITKKKQIPFVNYEGKLVWGTPVEQGVSPEMYDNGVRIVIEGKESIIEASGLIVPIEQQYQARLDQALTESLISVYPGRDITKSETIAKRSLEHLERIVQHVKQEAGIELTPDWTRFRYPTEAVTEVREAVERGLVPTPTEGVTPATEAAKPVTPEVMELESARNEIQRELEYAQKRVLELRQALKEKGGTREKRIWNNNELARNNTLVAEYGRLLRENNPEELVRYIPKAITPTAPAVKPTAIPKVEAPPPVAEVSRAKAEFISKAEEVAVTEVAGSPPKPPKDWDKIGGELYDKFKRQAPEPTPNTVPLSDRILRAKKGLEKITTDEFARLNALGWQAEMDVAMVRASRGQAAELYRETMRNVSKILNNDSNLLSYVDDYLMLHHQLEVLKATGRKYFTMKKGDITQRFTAKQIGLLFAQMKKELGVANYERVKEAATQIPAIYNQILRGTAELTKEQIEGLISKYPWYNPILFAKETTPVNIARKLSPRQVRQLTTLEADKEMLSPLMSLPSIISRRMKAQAINDARKSVATEAIKPENKVLIGGAVEIVEKKPEGGFIDYFENGVRKYLKLGKGADWMAKDIELLQRQPPSIVISMVRSIQNLSKMAFTTYNPGFMVWNTAFDGMTAFFAEGIGPWGFGKALAGNIKAIFKDVPAVSEFRKAGGEMMGFFEKMGTGEVEKVVTPFIKKQKGRIVLRNPESLKRFINPFELIRELGIAGENAARRAAFEKAIKEGLPSKEAGLRARRVTVDFSRFSAASRHINDWFIYFNPALQGFYLPARAMIKDPNSIWRLAAIIAGYVGLNFYNQSYDEYKDVQDSDKVGKLLIMLPSDEYNKYGQKVPHYITLLPLREFALFTAPIEYLMGKLRTEDPESYRTLAQEWGVLYPAISPLSMISESGGLVMPTQVAATIQQIMQNHDDFRDRPIVDDEMALLPPAQQYDVWTDKLAIRIGQALNMSPKKLDFFAQNMFGALGRDFLRTVDLAISQLDREQVDKRIATLVTQLRDIPSTVPPGQIEVARETFLEGLSVEDRDVVLSMERLATDQIPFITSISDRFYRKWGGQVYATAKEKALTARTLEDYPPEALEALQESALENTNNLLKGKISRYDFDKNMTRYRAYYSGGATAEWRQGMKEGAVSKREVEKFMPESYKRAEEFQAVSAYNEIRAKFIDEAGGVFDAETWDEIEEKTITELGNFYSESSIQYAIAHKDDWMDNLPEVARQVHREMATMKEDESWWDGYRGEPVRPSRPKAPSRRAGWVAPWNR